MTRTREAPTPFTPEEEAAERAYIAEYVSDPRLGRWLATLDAARTGGGAFTRAVPLDYPAAVQAIAALDNRIREYQSHVAHGLTGVEFAVADAHRAVTAIRETFGVERHRPYDEDAGVSPQLAQYQAESR